MAKFIAIKSSGAAEAGGDLLLGVEGILNVYAFNPTTTVVKYNGTEATITHTALATPYTQVRNAVNAALTANPGGVKARVQLPAGVTVSSIAIA
jgi:hypothetical protein